MRIQKHIIFIATILLLVQSCDIFSTRTPELPDTGRSSFQPPFAPEIVIENFTNAVKEKNVDNFAACFSDTSKNFSNSYRFIPSTEALGKYGTMFFGWDIESERKAFSSLMSNMESDVFPLLILSNNEQYSFEIKQQDSAVFESDYHLTVNHSRQTIEPIFAGTLRFLIKPGTDGTWSIEQWTDMNPSNDSVSVTWSSLKAGFIN
ncbi:MAG: hypothetical protein KAH48_00560 [Chlorobi bacterium]|nr:hypothetical protein [Chlorobiota bacterium]